MEYYKKHGVYLQSNVFEILQLEIHKDTQVDQGMLAIRLRELLRMGPISFIQFHVTVEGFRVFILVSFKTSYILHWNFLTNPIVSNGSHLNYN